MSEVVEYNNPQLSKSAYASSWRHLKSLPMVAIVTTGRTGSDFLQSLFDDHSQILTFNGHFAIYSEFFCRNKCFNNVNSSLSERVDAFIETYRYKLISKLEMQERKDQLGKNFNQSFAFDLDNFKSHMIAILEETDGSTASFLLAIYGSYAICQGRNIHKAKVIVHHPHLNYEFEKFIPDFPKSRVIFTTRDPRANFCSHVEHFRDYYETHDNQSHVNNCVQMIFDNTLVARKRRLDYISTRLEDLPSDPVLLGLASWLGVDFEKSLRRSSWTGLDWHGDRLSKKVFVSEGWDPNRGENKWEIRLGSLEKYVFNFLLNDRLRKSGYKYKKVSILDAWVVPFVLVLPWRYERRFFSLKYFWLSFFRRGRYCKKMAVATPYFYIKRVILCYIQYSRVVAKSGEEVFIVGPEKGQKTPSSQL
jgi:hypothetical protein